MENQDVGDKRNATGEADGAPHPKRQKPEIQPDAAAAAPMEDESAGAFPEAPAFPQPPAATDEKRQEEQTLNNDEIAGVARIADYVSARSYDIVAGLLLDAAVIYTDRPIYWVKCMASYLISVTPHLTAHFNPHPLVAEFMSSALADRPRSWLTESTMCALLDFEGRFGHIVTGLSEMNFNHPTVFTLLARNGEATDTVLQFVDIDGCGRDRALLCCYLQEMFHSNRMDCVEQLVKQAPALRMQVHRELIRFMANGPMVRVSPFARVDWDAKSLHRNYASVSTEWDDGVEYVEGINDAIDEKGYKIRWSADYYSIQALYVNAVPEWQHKSKAVARSFFLRLCMKRVGLEGVFRLCQPGVGVDVSDSDIRTMCSIALANRLAMPLAPYLTVRHVMMTSGRQFVARHLQLLMEGGIFPHFRISDDEKSTVVVEMDLVSVLIEHYYDVMQSQYASYLASNLPLFVHVRNALSVALKMFDWRRPFGEPLGTRHSEGMRNVRFLTCKSTEVPAAKLAQREFFVKACRVAQHLVLVAPFAAIAIFEGVRAYSVAANPAQGLNGSVSRPELMPAARGLEMRNTHRLLRVLRTLRPIPQSAEQKATAEPTVYDNDPLNCPDSLVYPDNPDVQMSYWRNRLQTDWIDVRVPVYRDTAEVKAALAQFALTVPRPMKQINYSYGEVIMKVVNATDTVVRTVTSLELPVVRIPDPAAERKEDAATRMIARSLTDDTSMTDEDRAAAVRVTRALKHGGRGVSREVLYRHILSFLSPVDLEALIGLDMEVLHVHV
jgi:hypothetical protein